MKMPGKKTIKMNMVKMLYGFRVDRENKIYCLG